MLHLRAVTVHEQANEYNQNTRFVDVKLQFNLKQYKQHSHRGQNNQQLVAISNNGKKNKLVNLMTKGIHFLIQMGVQSLLKSIGHAECNEELLVKGRHPLFVDRPVQDAAWTQHAPAEEERLR